MNNSSPTRDLFWDSLKFFLIFIVIYGHMIETCVNDSPFNQTMYNFIYLFHMPLFVLISGRFSQIKNRRKYLWGMLSIFETYIVFQFLRCLKPIIFQGSLPSFTDILIPKGILWYLVCILLWRLIIVILMPHNLQKHKWHILFFFFITGLGFGFTQIHDGTITRFFGLGIFFFVGLYLNDVKLKNFLSKFQLVAAIAILLLLWLLVYIYINFDIRSVIYFKNYYSNPNLSPEFHLWARLCLYIFATAVGLCLMKAIYVKPLMATYGRYTLAIFMYHTSIVLTIRALIDKGIMPPNEVLLFCVSVIICTTIAYLTHHFKIMSIMLNPISYITRKCISLKR